MDRKKRIERLALTAILTRYGIAWHLGNYDMSERTHALALAWVGGHVTAQEVLEEMSGRGFTN